MEFFNHSVIMKELIHFKFFLSYTLFFGSLVGVGGMMGYVLCNKGWDKTLYALPFLAILFSLGWWFFQKMITYHQILHHRLDKMVKETLHEINIPIATILANVTIIENDARVHSHQHRLGRIKKSCEQLHYLYKNLDLFIRQEIQQERCEAIELSELLYEREEIFRELYPYYSFESHYETYWIRSDRQGVVQVIDNLLSNSVKYSQPHTTIKLLLSQGIVTVDDQGEGIAPDELVKIFDRYYQSDKKNHGMGLGLHVVKTFCDAHKIGLRIESLKGVGTKIHLNFHKLQKPS